MAKPMLLSTLQSAFGQYIDGIDADSLKVGVWKGEVEMVNLRLKKSCLAALQLPVEVLGGYVGRLTVEVPWNGLERMPVQVEIDKVFLLVGSKEEFTPPSAEELADVLRQKLAELGTLEIVRQRESVLAPEEEAEKEGYFAALGLTILANLQVTVRNIHLRFEDAPDRAARGPAGMAGRAPVAVGIGLDVVKLATVDEGGQPTFVDSSKRVGAGGSASNKEYKSAELSNLRVYLHDSSEEAHVQTALPEHTADAIEVHWAATMRAADARGGYILSPTSMHVTLTIAKPPDYPKLEVRGDIESIQLAMSKIQFASISLMSAQMSELTYLLRLGRPFERPGHGSPHTTVRTSGGCEVTRRWWRYAMEGLADLPRTPAKTNRLNRMRKYSWWKLFGTHIRRPGEGDCDAGCSAALPGFMGVATAPAMPLFMGRKVYLPLWKRRIGKGADHWHAALGADEEEALLKLEGMLPNESVLVFRSIAEHQLDKERFKAGLLKAGKTGAAEAAAAASWFGASWFESTDADVEDIVLTGDEQHELLKAVDQTISAQNEFMRSGSDTYVAAKANLSLREVSILLAKGAGQPVCEVALQNIQFDAFARKNFPASESWQAKVQMESISVLDTTQGEVPTLFPQILSMDNSEAGEVVRTLSHRTVDCSALQVVLDAMPMDDSFGHDYRAMFSIKTPVRYSHNPGWLQHASDIFRVDNSRVQEMFANAYDATAEGATEMVADAYDAADEFMQTRKTVQFTADINAPVLVVPESCYLADAPIAKLDLGKLDLGSSNLHHFIAKQKVLSIPSAAENAASIPDGSANRLELRLQDVSLQLFNSHRAFTKGDGETLLERIGFDATAYIAYTGEGKSVAEIDFDEIKLATSARAVASLTRIAAVSGTSEEVVVQAIAGGEEDEDWTDVSAIEKHAVVYAKIKAVEFNMKKSDGSENLLFASKISGMEFEAAVGSERPSATFRLRELELLNMLTDDHIVYSRENGAQGDELESTMSALPAEGQNFLVTLMVAQERTTKQVDLDLKLSQLLINWKPEAIGRLSESLQNDLAMFEAKTGVSLYEDGAPVAAVEVGKADVTAMEGGGDGGGVMQGTVVKTKGVLEVAAHMEFRRLRICLFKDSFVAPSDKVVDVSNVLPTKKMAQLELDTLKADVQLFEDGIDGSGELEQMRISDLCDQSNFEHKDAMTASLKFNYVNGGACESSDCESKLDVEISSFVFVFFQVPILELSDYLLEGVLGVLVRMTVEAAESAYLIEDGHVDYAARNIMQLKISEPEIHVPACASSELSAATGSLTMQADEITLVHSFDIDEATNQVRRDQKVVTMRNAKIVTLSTAEDFPNEISEKSFTIELSLTERMGELALQHVDEMMLVEGKVDDITLRLGQEQLQVLMRILGRNISQKLEYHAEQFVVHRQFRDPANYYTDNRSSQCMCCEQPFTTMIRPGHCTWCGELVCWKCNSKQIWTESLAGGGKPQWVCAGCYQRCIDEDNGVRLSEGASGAALSERLAPSEQTVKYGFGDADADALTLTATIRMEQLKLTLDRKADDGANTDLGVMLFNEMTYTMQKPSNGKVTTKAEMTGLEVRELETAEPEKQQKIFQMLNEGNEHDADVKALTYMEEVFPDGACHAQLTVANSKVLLLPAFTTRLLAVFASSSDPAMVEVAQGPAEERKTFLDQAPYSIEVNIRSSQFLFAAEESEQSPMLILTMDECEASYMQENKGLTKKTKLHLIDVKLNRRRPVGDDQVEHSVIEKFSPHIMMDHEEKESKDAAKRGALVEKINFQSTDIVVCVSLQLLDVISELQTAWKGASAGASDGQAVESPPARTSLTREFKFNAPFMRVEVLNDEGGRALHLFVAQLNDVTGKFTLVDIPEINDEPEIDGSLTFEAAADYWNIHHHEWQTFLTLTDSVRVDFSQRHQSIVIKPIIVHATFTMSNCVLHSIVSSMESWDQQGEALPEGCIEELTDASAFVENHFGCELFVSLQEPNKERKSTEQLREAEQLLEIGATQSVTWDSPFDRAASDHAELTVRLQGYKSFVVLIDKLSEGIDQFYPLDNLEAPALNVNIRVELVDGGADAARFRVSIEPTLRIVNCVNIELELLAISDRGGGRPETLGDVSAGATFHVPLRYAQTPEIHLRPGGASGFSLSSPIMVSGSVLVDSIVSCRCNDIVLHFHVTMTQHSTSGSAGGRFMRTLQIQPVLTLHNMLPISCDMQIITAMFLADGREQRQDGVGQPVSLESGESEQLTFMSKSMSEVGLRIKLKVASPIARGTHEWTDVLIKKGKQVKRVFIPYDQSQFEVIFSVTDTVLSLFCRTWICNRSGVTLSYIVGTKAGSTKTFHMETHQNSHIAPLQLGTPQDLDPDPASLPQLRVAVAHVTKHHHGFVLVGPGGEDMTRRLILQSPDGKYIYDFCVRVTKLQSALVPAAGVLTRIITIVPSYCIVNLSEHALMVQSMNKPDSKQLVPGGMHDLGAIPIHPQPSYAKQVETVGKIAIQDVLEDGSESLVWEKSKSLEVSSSFDVKLTKLSWESKETRKLSKPVMREHLEVCDPLMPGAHAFALYQDGTKRYFACTVASIGGDRTDGATGETSKQVLVNWHDKDQKHRSVPIENVHTAWSSFRSGEPVTAVYLRAGGHQSHSRAFEGNVARADNSTKRLIIDWADGDEYGRECNYSQVLLKHSPDVDQLILHGMCINRELAVVDLERGSDAEACGIELGWTVDTVKGITPVSLYELEGIVASCPDDLPAEIEFGFQTSESRVPLGCEVRAGGLTECRSLLTIGVGLVSEAIGGTPRHASGVKSPPPQAAQSSTSMRLDLKANKISVQWRDMDPTVFRHAPVKPDPLDIHPMLRGLVMITEITGMQVRAVWDDQPRSGSTRKLDVSELHSTDVIVRELSITNANDESMLAIVPNERDGTQNQFALELHATDVQTQGTIHKVEAMTVQLLQRVHVTMSDEFVATLMLLSEVLSDHFSDHSHPVPAPQQMIEHIRTSITSQARHDANLFVGRFQLQRFDVIVTFKRESTVMPELFTLPLPIPVLRYMIEGQTIKFSSFECSDQLGTVETIQNAVQEHLIGIALQNIAGIIFGRKWKVLSFNDITGGNPLAGDGSMLDTVVDTVFAPVSIMSGMVMGKASKKLESLGFKQRKMSDKQIVAEHLEQPTEKLNLDQLCWDWDFNHKGACAKYCMMVSVVNRTTVPIFLRELELRAGSICYTTSHLVEPSSAANSYAAKSVVMAVSNSLADVHLTLRSVAFDAAVVTAKLSVEVQQHRPFVANVARKDLHKWYGVAEIVVSPASEIATPAFVHTAPRRAVDPRASLALQTAHHEKRGWLIYVDNQAPYALSLQNVSMRSGKLSASPPREIPPNTVVVFGCRTDGGMNTASCNGSCTYVPKPPQGGGIATMKKGRVVLNYTNPGSGGIGSGGLLRTFGVVEKKPKECNGAAEGDLRVESHGCSQNDSSVCCFRIFSASPAAADGGAAAGSSVGADYLPSVPGGGGAAAYAGEV